MIPNAKFVALGLISLCAIGCGSGGSGNGTAAAGPSCQAVAACGGDLTGTWQIDSECLSIDSPFDQPECQGTIHDVSVVIDGTVSYVPTSTDGNVGTQTSSFDYKFEASEQYSEACLEALGFEGATTDSCHGLELLWAGAVSVSCALQGSYCQCDFADAQNSTDTEDYGLANDQLVMTGTDPVDYCRTGDHLVESASTGSSRSVISMHLQTP